MSLYFIQTTVLQDLVAVVDDLIAYSPTTRHKHPAVHPLVPLVACLHCHVQSHAVLVCTDLFLPKTLNELLLTSPRACRLQVNDRAVVSLQIISGVEVCGLDLFAGRRDGGIADDFPVCWDPSSVECLKMFSHEYFEFIEDLTQWKLLTAAAW